MVGFKESFKLKCQTLQSMLVNNFSTSSQLFTKDISSRNDKPVGKNVET